VATNQLGERLNVSREEPPDEFGVGCVGHLRTLQRRLGGLLHVDVREVARERQPPEHE